MTKEEIGKKAADEIMGVLSDLAQNIGDILGRNVREAAEAFGEGIGRITKIVDAAEDDIKAAEASAEKDPTGQETK